MSKNIPMSVELAGDNDPRGFFSYVQKGCYLALRLNHE